MGLERAHAQLLGQGQGLTVRDFGLLDIRRIVMRSDLAEESVDPRLVSPFFVRSGEIEGTLRAPDCIIRSLGEFICLTEPGDLERMPAQDSHGSGLFHRLFQERYGIGNASGQGIRSAQRRRDHREPVWVVPGLEEGEGPFEHGDGLEEFPLAEVKSADCGIRPDQVD